MDKSAYEKDANPLRTYVIGFAISIVLTLISYFLVMNSSFSRYATVIAINVLALIQLFVQLRFFLHLGKEKAPRWNLIIFLCMVVFLAIVVFGSLWIMNELNDNMIPQLPILSP